MFGKLPSLVCLLCIPHHAGFPGKVNGTKASFEKGDEDE